MIMPYYLITTKVYNCLYLKSELITFFYRIKVKFKIYYGQKQDDESNG